VKGRIAGFVLPGALAVGALGAGALSAGALRAQGVTTASMTGRVSVPGDAGVPGARVTAVHLPSGTSYGATTRADGRYTILGMRVGGPYRVTARALGFAPQTRDGIALALGTAADVSFAAERVATQLSAVTVTAQAAGTLSSTRTGAATAVSREAIQTLPTISRTIGDFTRLTPQASGTSFAGQDNRLNNITVDGSYFNNSFGLSGQPGGRTGVAPLPLDAIDQIQVNVAPFDVRQGNFVGAGVNAVTRSGTNEFEGSAYLFDRNQDYVGRFADVNRFNPGTFTFRQVGARLGGPILRDRLFFFANFEDDRRSEPGTTFLARTSAGETVGGNTTRVLASDVTRLQQFLADRFQYQTGPVTGYSNLTPSRRFIGKLDYNVSEKHKASLRYIQLDSKSDNLVSNSNSLGFGNRRTNQNALSFENSGYAVLENIRSLVGEVNSQFGGRVSNNLIVGYTTNDESRESKGTFFPTVDVLQGGLTYLSFGFEPFTPANQLRYNTLQFQNNLTVLAARHELTFGVTAQRYRSDNVFFSGANSVYTYNSLDDFYADANDFLASPTRTQSPVTLRRFEVRYNNIPGQAEPVQPLRVLYAGAYAQDEWRATDRLRLTLGLRADVPRFENTGFLNPQANALTFRDENGRAVQYRTEKLPNANVLFSPRLGVNWDVRGDKSTQVRGGTGVFTGSPAFVWISNQIGENGIQTGFIRENNTRAFPFNPDPDAYKRQPSGQSAPSYQLALTDPDFRFPQVWRSNLALDQRLPGGVVATLEGLYGRDVNGTYYINANLAAPTGTFAGPDQRPRWVNAPGPSSANATRLNQNVDNAVVLKNQNVGRAWNLAASLEKAFRGGFYAKAAYSYGEAKNTVDAGSIAFGSWNGNPHAGDPNNPGLGFSTNSPGHRAFLALSYKARVLPIGETGVSLFAESRTLGNTSYTFSGDLNGDGGTSNDLLYVPRDRSEMNFEQFTVGTGASARTFTAAEQADAWEAYIQQDEYLRANRGRYAERGAVFLPRLFRTDLTLTQDVARVFAGRRNAFQLRLDVLNVGNLLARDWGVAQRLVTNTPLVIGANRPTADGQGRAVYRLRNFGNQLLAPRTFERAAGLTDVYQFQLGVRYLFN
jgi:outer membrane receptor protein involved in Fe transport